MPSQRIKQVQNDLEHHRIMMQCDQGRRYRVIDPESSQLDFMYLHKKPEKNSVIFHRLSTDYENLAPLLHGDPLMGASTSS